MAAPAQKTKSRREARRDGRIIGRCGVRLRLRAVCSAGAELLAQAAGDGRWRERARGLFAEMGAAADLSRLSAA
jgi:hypothetical protein